MDVETPTGGRDKTEGFASEKRRTFHRGTLTEPYLGGLYPLRWNVGLGRHRTSPRRLMMSSSFMDVLGDSHGSLARIAGWRSLRRANILLQEAAFSLERANVTLEGAGRLAFALLGFNL
jgi:hypothetical protein